MRSHTITFVAGHLQMIFFRQIGRSWRFALLVLNNFVVDGLFFGGNLWTFWLGWTVLFLFALFVYLIGQKWVDFSQMRTSDTAFARFAWLYHWVQIVEGEILIELGWAFQASRFTNIIVCVAQFAVLEVIGVIFLQLWVLKLWFLLNWIQEAG